jgi:phosphoribosylformylglycinamidine synthase
MKKPKILIISAPLINCEIETFNAFKFLGAKPEIVHINALLKKDRKVTDYDILVVPGGFSYGDDIAGGTILAGKVKRLMPELLKFNKSKKPIIGICNGFQVLIKAGMLPFEGEEQTVSLTTNDCGHYIDQWEQLKVNKKSPCIFTKGLPDFIELPIAHGEGKFVADSDKILNEITNKNLVVLSYTDNPNGSARDIAGITNLQGNVFGLMPHPERFVLKYHHPLWARKKTKIVYGLEILKNAVDYVG